jgi:hypothetical protein
MLSYEAWTDGRTAVCHNKPPYFDGRIKMNGPYPEITNISFLAKLFFKTFISLKHLSDYRTVGLSDCRTIGLSDYSYGPITRRFTLKNQKKSMDKKLDTPSTLGHGLRVTKVTFARLIRDVSQLSINASFFKFPLTRTWQKQT